MSSPTCGRTPHQEELANVICAVNLDMVGEDPEKTRRPHAD